MAIGEVNEKEHVVEWKIRNFFLLSQKVNKSYCSTDFAFAGASWCLEILPNGEKGISDGYIDLYLHRNSNGPAKSLAISMGLKTFDEKICSESCFSYVYKKREGRGIDKFFKKSELLERIHELLPDGSLSVICRISTDNFVRTKCECGKYKLEPDEDLSSHQQKGMDVMCRNCSDDIACSSENDYEKVLSDLKDMMLSGDHSDTTIMVQGEEFRVHRNILAARSPYFHAMFKNDMKEKITGVVSIDDCESDIFRSFIHFLYTGKTDKLSSENVCGLYEAANKYQEHQLQKICLHFMTNAMSVDNFCDFIVIALRHDDKTLLEDATKFFSSKTKEIIRSVKWQSFLLEYPIQANELHIKALDFFDN